MVRRLFILAAFVGGSCLTAYASEILWGGHVDHAFRYSGGTWDISIIRNGPDDVLDPDETVMVILDRPFPSEGGQVVRPSGSRWDFLGVEAGDPIWIIPQAFTSHLWAGWRSEGNLAEYFNPDPRLGFVAPFVEVSLEQFGHSGSGEGHFSIWSNQTGGATTVWIASADGITDQDSYFFSSGHSHTNLGFSAPGVYQVDLRAKAFVRSGGSHSPVESPPQSFFYVIGAYAEWKAGFFSPADLVDQDPTDDTPEIAHPKSDTDRDGVPLLLEYAFNLSPEQKDGELLTPGEGLAGMPAIYLDTIEGERKLVIEYVRRRAGANAGITYRPQFSANLNETWREAAEEIVTPIDATWERVRAIDEAFASDHPQRFGRVQVVLD